MREETTTRMLYTFAELSDSAKEKARDEYRETLNNEGPDWADFALEEATRIADILGIEISTRTVKLYGGGTRREPVFSWSLGRDYGVGFSGRYRYAQGSTKAIREYAPQDVELHNIADTLREVQRRHFYKLWADISETRQSVGVSVSVETDGPETLSADDAETVEQAIRGYAHWIYNQLRAEDEYRYSDEQVDEALSEDGDNEFTEYGRRA